MHDLIHHSRADGGKYLKEDCRIFQAFRTGKDTHVDDEVLWRADGTSIPAEYRSRTLRRDGKVVGTVVSFTDITARKREEEALSASEQRFRDFAGAASDWFWEMDADLKFTFISDRYFDFVTLSADAVIGKKRRDLAGTSQIETEPEKWRAHFDDLDARRPIRNFEYSITGTDDKTRHVRISSVPVFGMDGEFRGYRGTGTDETDLKQANIALEEAKEEAEFANRTKTEFLANISHELRTPLTMISGGSHILTSEMFGPIGSAKYLEYASDMGHAGEYLLELINDLLKISQIETGRLELRESNLDVEEIFASCHIFLEGRTQEAGLELRTEAEQGIPAIHADETRIKQVLLNLLTNAIKFTPTGGTVTLKAGTDEEGRLVVSVVDTGIGIGAENITKVLEPFVQVENILTRSHEGAGIGLPLAKKLMELHGGTLELESELGAGTTVSVRFPPERLIRQKNTPSNCRPRVVCHERRMRECGAQLYER